MQEVFVNNNFEFNKIQSNNAEQLKPKSYYSANYIGQTQNKANIQQPSKESENKVEIKEKEVKTTQTKAAANSKLLTTFIAAISSVVIGVTSIGGILPETVPTTLTATFQETYATEHEIFYCVEIGDSRNRVPEEEFSGADGRVEEYYEDDIYYEIDLTDLYVVLHNEFTDRKEKIEEQFWSGCFENLQEHMTYKLEVRYKDYVLASETMRTELEPEEEDYVDPEEPYTEPITGDDIGGDPYTEPINVDGDGGDYTPSNPSNYDPDDPNNPDGTDNPTNNTDGNNTGGQTGNDDPDTAIVGAG